LPWPAKTSILSADRQEFAIRKTKPTGILDYLSWLEHQQETQIHQKYNLKYYHSSYRSMHQKYHLIYNHSSNHINQKHNLIYKHSSSKQSSWWMRSQIDLLLP
jgi:hypothetical protein